VTTERHRTAARALVRSPDGRVLMIRGHDPADPGRGGFWFTPGGGLDAGESVEAGLRRELSEEIGLQDASIGPLVLRRHDRFPLLGEIWLQEETLHLVSVDEAFEPDGSGLEEIEASVITGFRWLSAGDLRGSPDPFYPRCLADLLDEIGERGPPATPWSEDVTAPTDGE